ncbi:MAG: cytochrome C [Chloroflexi bacterium]|nr:cytochrome C [Chloroflexota bacterium]
MTANISSAVSLPEKRWLTWLPTLMWIVAAALLLVSITLPYWGMVLQAPQYPGGLRMRVFINTMTGDEDPRLDEVREIDGLNHYIGMQSLYNAAQIERAIALPALLLMAAFLVVAGFWRRRWTWLLTLPALGLPVVFLADLGLWLRYYGQTLDPYAPLSSAIQPFVPPVLGVGVIGQFSTESFVDTGWYLAAGAAALIIVGLFTRWWLAKR